MKKVLAVLLTLVLVFSLAACGSDTSSGDAGATNEKVEWKLASCWTDGTFMYEIDKHWCDTVSELTGGNFTITPYGVGTLGAATEVFDLVQNGTVQAGGDWPSYWSGKDLGFDLLATTMFDFSQWDYYLWIYEGGGWEDAYNYMFNQHGMTYFPNAACGMESGIRSKEPINSIADMQKMKIRLTGKMQQAVAEKIGVSATAVSANELYESLQRGVIDAAEYSVPSNDKDLNITEICKYWLTPGWHQTSSLYGAMVNLDAYNALPAEYQDALKKASEITFVEYSAKYTWRDAAATTEFVEGDGVTLTTLPEEDMDKIQAAYEEVTEQFCAESENYKHVYESMQAYRDHMYIYRQQLGDWSFGTNLD